VALGVSSDIALVNEKLLVPPRDPETDILFDPEKTSDPLKGNDKVRLWDFDSDRVKLNDFVWEKSRDFEKAFETEKVEVTGR
jgi:hypothetical protein